jgi:hypothetical protein
MGEIDLLEIDIQSSEYFALPPAIKRISQKVRRVHMGTHGAEIHEFMVNLFRGQGWEIEIDLMPETDYIVPGGQFSTDDGVMAARNPNLKF